MKKIFALLIAFAMIAVLGVPAFADNAEPIFNTVFTRVENEPTVEYDEWEIPYNVWTPMENSAPIAIVRPVVVFVRISVSHCVLSEIKPPKIMKNMLCKTKSGAGF